MGKGLYSQIDSRLGRATCITIVDPETVEYEAVENIQNFDLPHIKMVTWNPLINPM